MDGPVLAQSDRTSVFEVLTPDGHAYRVWADGRVEGFPAQAIVINRVPQYANDRVAKALAQ